MAKRAIFRRDVFEVTFLIFPFWIGAVYVLLINFFPDHRVLVFTLFVLILGETHFAATWMFFTLPENRIWTRTNFNKIVAIPVFILAPYLILGLENPGMAALLGSIFSAVQVTRQSIGIARLYGVARNSLDEAAIYLFSSAFIIVGACRFVFPDFYWIPKILKEDSFINRTVSIVLLLTSLYFISIILSKREAKLKLCLITGVALYSPYCFVSNSYDAVAIGVGMHWCQYLAMTYAVYLRSHSLSQAKTSGTFVRKLIFISVYAIVTTAVITKAGSLFRWETALLAIPLTLQAYHYYLDAFIWKFSDPELRLNIGSRLFKFTRD